MHKSSSRLLSFLLLCFLSTSLVLAAPVSKGKGKGKGSSIAANAQSPPQGAAAPSPLSKAEGKRPSRQYTQSGSSRPPAPQTGGSSHPQAGSSSVPVNPKNIPNYNPNYNPHPDVYAHGDFVGARVKYYEDTKSDSIHPGVVVGGPDANRMYKVAMISNKLPGDPPQKAIAHYQANTGLEGSVSHDVPKDVAWQKMKMWKQKNSGHGDRQPMMAPEKVKELKVDINKGCEGKGVHLTRRGVPGGGASCGKPSNKAKTGPNAIKPPATPKKSPKTTAPAKKAAPAPKSVVKKAPGPKQGAPKKPAVKKAAAPKQGSFKKPAVKKAAAPKGSPKKPTVKKAAAPKQGAPKKPVPAKAPGGPQMKTQKHPPAKSSKPPAKKPTTKPANQPPNKGAQKKAAPPKVKASTPGQKPHVASKKK